MYKIEYVKQGVTKGRVLLGISDGDESRAYSVTEATYCTIGAPVRGEEISDMDYSGVTTEDERYRAMKRAVSVIAASDKSAYALRTKLIMAGFRREIIDEVICECMARGYIDEARQLERLVEREANGSLRGKYYIKRKLISKGYRTADIDRAISGLVETGEVDFDANLEKLAQKKGAFDEESRRALIYKYGYRI